MIEESLSYILNDVIGNVDRSHFVFQPLAFDHPITSPAMLVYLVGFVGFFAGLYFIDEIGKKLGVSKNGTL